MYPKQTRIKIVSGFFVASLFIRLLTVSIFPETHLGTNAKIAYLEGAHLIVEGDGLRDPSYPVFTPPLYAVFIAMSLYLFGDGQIPVKIAQAFADSLTVVMVYLITKHIFGYTTAFLSIAILSIYPFVIYPVTYIGTETFFTLFLSIFVLLCIYAVKYEKLGYYLAAGIVLGLATLIRGTTQFYPLFFLPILASLRKMDKIMLQSYLVFIVSFGLVILPWSLRNYVVLNDFIPVATAGSVFLQGSSEKFFTIDGKTKELPKYFEVLRLKGITKPSTSSRPSEKDRFLMRAGLENYRVRLESDPLSMFPFMLKKFFRLWYSTESGRNHGIILAINMLIYPFALGGIILAWVRRKELALLLLGLILYFVILHWVSLPLFRYMVPVMPYVIGLGSFAVIALMGEVEVTGSKLC